MCVCVCVCVCARAHVCGCVWVLERERERERKRKKEVSNLVFYTHSTITQRETDRQTEKGGGRIKLGSNM